MPPESHPDLSVVVLSYNRPRLLARALESIERQEVPAEVIVVDNRSDASDAVRDVVRGRPGVRLLGLTENRGFTGGMNHGIRAAHGDYVYLTEDDIELRPGCLTALLAFLRHRPDVGLAGPVMVNRGDGSVRCAGGLIRLGGVFRLQILAQGEPSDRIDPQPKRVDFLPGAALMARRSLWLDLGGFRDEFFMYQEDVDLCARVQARGLAVAVVPDAMVAHEDPGPDVGADGPDLAFHKLKNLLAVYVLHARWHVLPSVVLRYGLLAAGRAFLHGHLGLHARAWGWTLRHLPSLLADRGCADGRRALVSAS